MLKRLLLTFGGGSNPLGLECPVGTVTLFVGPNNSGKSQALADILRQIGSALAGTTVVGELELEPPKDERLQEEFISSAAEGLLKIREAPPVVDERDALYRIGDTKGPWGRMVCRRRLDLFAYALMLEKDASGSSSAMPRQPITKAMQHIHAQLKAHASPEELRTLTRSWAAQGFIRFVGYSHLLRKHTIKLDGATRLSLVQDTAAPDWRAQDEVPRNTLVDLLKNPQRLDSLRRLVHKEFGSYPVIDTTHPGKTSLKLAEAEPASHERSTTPEALAYFDRARPLDQFSDGMRSFIGLLAAILSGDHRITLLDEPEAFLHPPLARSLGTDLYHLARSQRAQVLAATHSPDFLMGCVQAGPEVSIIRLTFKSGQPDARILSPVKLRSVMRHPLLRSTGVFGALFHEGAVVCESDSDRAFYQEVNERLLAEGRGAPGCAFLNAQNKQTLHRIVAPLREMGVPAAAIVDLDVVSKGDDLRRLLDAAQANPSARESLLQAKDRFFRLFCSVAGSEEEAKKQMKRCGVSLLPEGDRKALRTFLLEPLADHGIFVVPCGELESWLPGHVQGVGRSDKAKWLMHVFERMGDDPDAPGYLRPQQDDVWAFVDRLAAWIASPGSGMPSAA